MSDIKLSDEMAQLIRDSVSSPDLVDLPNSPFDVEEIFFQLKEQIETYQANIDNNHDIALMLTNFGESVTMVITSITYRTPSLLVFTGYVNNSICELIQHVNQLNFLLKTVPRNIDLPKQRIGFSYTPSS